MPLTWAFALVHRSPLPSVPSFIFGLKQILFLNNFEWIWLHFSTAMSNNTFYCYFLRLLLLNRVPLALCVCTRASNKHVYCFLGNRWKSASASFGGRAASKNSGHSPSFSSRQLLRFFNIVVVVSIRLCFIVWAMSGERARLWMQYTIHHCYLSHIALSGAILFWISYFRLFCLFS